MNDRVSLVAAMDQLRVAVEAFNEAWAAAYPGTEQSLYGGPR